MEPLAQPALAAVADGHIAILPDRFVKTYNTWLENIKVPGLHLCLCLCLYLALIFFHSFYNGRPGTYMLQ